MKVEKLIGTSPSSTFADLKNNVRNANFTHKITWDYTDFTGTDDALNATVNAPLALEPGTTNEKGLLKGWLVRDVVAYTRVLPALPNIATAKFDLGPVGGSGDDDDFNKLIFSGDNLAAGGWDAYADDGDGDLYGYIVKSHCLLGGKLTCTVSSGSAKLDSLTAGQIEVYMEIVDCNSLLTEGAWAEVKL
jgi:hypothetical protein